MNIWLSCGDVRFWHEAAIRKCLLLRRSWNDKCWLNGKFCRKMSDEEGRKEFGWDED
jgi:hypothetical protein